MKLLLVIKAVLNINLLPAIICSLLIKSKLKQVVIL